MRVTSGGTSEGTFPYFCWLKILLVLMYTAIYIYMWFGVALARGVAAAAAPRPPPRLAAGHLGPEVEPELL